MTIQFCQSSRTLFSASASQLCSIMPIPNPPVPKAPNPTKICFDPFNSSSTGHQRAESRLAGSTSWRESRRFKLSRQFRDLTGGGGETHLADLIGAGSEHFGNDGHKENGDWEIGAPGLREQGWQDVRGLLGHRIKPVDDGARGTKRKVGEAYEVAESAEYNEGWRAKAAVNRRLQKEAADKSKKLAQGNVSLTASRDNATTELVHENELELLTDKPKTPLMFSGLTIYINGSTAPLVSDHKLKQLLAQHGANITIGLARRTVTHVIVGDKEQGGGGLAGGKLQKEISRVRGKGVKFVHAKWVLDSVNAGKRQAEGQYQVVHLASAKQKTVYNMFRGNG